MTLLVLCVTGAWATDYVLDTDSRTSANKTNPITYTVSTLNFTILENGTDTGSSKLQGNGNNKTEKFTKNKTYTITVPASLTVTNIKFTGYTNKDDNSTAYIEEINGATPQRNGEDVTTSEETFAAKNAGSMSTYTYDATKNVSNQITFKLANQQQCCMYITITGTLPPTLTGTWSKTSDNVDKNASAPTLPTFAVGATSGTPEASNYGVEYSLKAGSTDGILTINASTGVTGISTSTTGTATCVATVTSTNTGAFKNPSPNTFEYTITVNELVCAAPTFTVYGNKVVKIECATAGSTIYYGGSDVKTGDKTEYTGQFIPANSGTIYAYATKTGFEDSDLSNQAITLPVAGDVVGNKLMLLQPATTPSGSYIYGDEGFVKGGFSIKGASIQNSNMSKYPNNFKVNGSADITVTPPSDVTIQSIKIYGANNNSETATTNVTVGSSFSIVNNAALMPKNVFVNDAQVMSEVVITPNSATEGATVVFRVGAQSRIYVEVYGTTSAENEAITPAKPYTTYIPNHDLDFTGHAKLTAYIATAANASSVTMTSVNKVPAGTPIVLKATETGAAINVPIAASTDDVSANKLVIGDGKTEIGGDGKYDYILKDGLFCKVTTASELAAGKCYLHLEAAPAAKELTIDFEDGDVTAIKAVEAKKVENGVFYNLAGQQVAQPTKGLYIVNGKKVVLK